MAKSKENTLSTASVLAFDHKLVPSDGYFQAGRWASSSNSDGWNIVAIREKTVRGTISNRLKKAAKDDPAKIDANPKNANIQTVDSAYLPMDCDTLKLSFTLRILPGLGTPHSCNNESYRLRLKEVVDQYIQTHGFSELSLRYAHNLANGRFLWRNRLNAEQGHIIIRSMFQGEVLSQWEFDPFNFSLKSFDTPPDASSQIQELAQSIQDGLAGSKPTLLEVFSFLRMGHGQEVYPSQEFIVRKDKSKNKTLFTAHAGAAGLHSQKIGNSIRTIDTWYSDNDDFNFPIAAEPYGSVTSAGAVFRPVSSHNDFYSLLDNWLLENKTPSLGNQHYVMAILIRGGVFGDGGKE